MLVISNVALPNPHAFGVAHVRSPRIAQETFIATWHMETVRRVFLRIDSPILTNHRMQGRPRACAHNIPDPDGAYHARDGLVESWGN